MPTLLAICVREADNELIAAECRSLTGGAPDGNGVARCETVDYVRRSSFIRHGVEVIARADSFAELQAAIRRSEFDATDFRVEWMKHGKHVEVDRRQGIVGVADAIERYYPNLDRPQHRFLLLARDSGFVFGEIVADGERDYQRHLAKPYRTSSALSPRLARAAINIAPRTTRSILDPCCGSGTIPIEAASMGLAVYGADRDPLAAQIARANLDHFGYGGSVDTADASAVTQRADAVVTDFPYGINLRRTEIDELRAILANAARLAPVGVFLAAADLTQSLQVSGYAGIELFRHRTQASARPITRTVHLAHSTVYRG